MIPEPRLASEYAVAPLLIRPIGCATPSACSPDLFRFVATEDATTITTTPNVGGGFLNEGDYLELTTSTPFVVQGNQPFAAYQYLIGTETLIGSSPAPDIGDPSMLDILPVEMYRKSYLFEAPPFVYDYLNVIAPVGTALVLDSAPISPTWTTVGTLNSVVYQCTQILVAPGTHELHSTNHAFSLTVTGIETYTASTFVAGFGEDCMPGGGWIRDTDDDDGGEPNPTSSAIWDSPDIWVRQQQDTALQFAHQHQAPLPNSVNYVYVKLLNMGCTPLAAGQLLTYFSKAATVNSWPSAWIGDPLNGDVIGSLPTPTIPVGGEVVLEFPWTPLLSGPSGILARFVSSADPMAFPEVSNVHTNAKNNNNIALKNLSVISPAEIAVAGGPVVDFVLLIGNVDSFPTSFELQFGDPEASPDTAFLAQGSVLLTLPDELFAAWELAGGVAHGLELLPGTTTFELRAPNARLAGLPLSPGEERALTLNFLQTRRQALVRRPCDPLVVRQHNMGTGTLEGGFTLAFALPRPGKRRAH